MHDDTRYAATDQAILKTIDKIRDEHGSCSAGQVANRLRMSRDTVAFRCQSMRDRGLVEWTAAHGSLRRGASASDTAQRLYDLLVQRAVEELAREYTVAEDGDAWALDLRQSPVAQWAFQVTAMATAAAWPGLVPQGYENKPGPVPSEPVVEAQTFRCDVCDREFTKAIALAGHRNSKAHLALAAAIG